VSDSGSGSSAPAPTGLLRKLGWQDAFWVASGVPAGVLFSIGAIAATIGQPSWLIWIVSIGIGFLQSFSYAEMAGLFPDKSGGTPVFASIAWAPYSRTAALLTVWCNWLAWSPVLALGTTLAAGYVLSALFPPNALVNTWSLKLLDLAFVKPGFALRLNALSLLAGAFLLLTFAFQSLGVAHAARMQKFLGIASLLPLLAVAIIPIVTGAMPSEHFLPLLPLTHDAAGHIAFGRWDAAGWTLAMGSLLMAGWSAYSFETAACYTREFRDPRSDTFKAICFSGLLCIFTYTLIPISFQGRLGLEGMMEPGVANGTGVGVALGNMMGGGVLVSNVIVAMLILSLLLVVTTSMMGASRTLYQSSVDGWMPRYLSHVNSHGVPTRAMATTLVFNIVLLLMSDYIAILAVASQCYLFFSFMSLQAVWIHRLDRPSADRPFRCATPLVVVGAVFGFLNLVFLGGGADIWGPGTLRNGVVAALVSIPLFWFRHYIQDKGRLPQAAVDEQQWSISNTTSRAGAWPYMCLLLGVLIICIAHLLAKPIS